MWPAPPEEQLDAVRKGQYPGCAVQLDSEHFATPCRWAEYSEGAWASVPVEVVSYMPPATEGGAASDDGSPTASGITHGSS